MQVLPTAGRGERRSRPRLLAAAALLAIGTAASATVGGGTATAQPSEQPAPSGPVFFEPAVGDQQTLFIGLSTGPCNTPGADGFNSVVAGPGVFAPGATEGNPDGRSFSANTQTDGFSTTGPIEFQQRVSFVELAREAGGPLLAGDYTVTFRCVDSLSGTIFQTYRTTLRITAGTGENFVVTVIDNPPRPTPAPTPTLPPLPTPTATAGSPTPGPTGSNTPTPTPTGSGTPTPTPTGSRSPSPSPSGSTSPSPSPSGSPTPAGSRTPSPTGSTTIPAGSTPTPTASGSGGSLAFTGGPIALLVGSGLALSAAGAGILARRRRGRP